MILPQGEINNRKFTGFEVITKEGVKYNYGGSIQYWETTASKAMPANPPGDYAVTSFFLKEIQHMNGEKIIFSYEDTTLVTNKISEIHSLYLVMGLNDIPNVEPGVRISTQTHYTRNKKRLLSISNSENLDTINFIYSDKADSDFKKYLSEIEYKVSNVVFQKVMFDYLFEDTALRPTIQRFFLTQVNFYKHNIFEKKYQFNYNSALELPERLTYAQDMFGLEKNKPLFLQWLIFLIKII